MWETLTHNQTQLPASDAALAPSRPITNTNTRDRGEREGGREGGIEEGKEEGGRGRRRERGREEEKEE